MGWYLRKAFRVGPVRLNLSRSGLGVSAGVRGARIGVGPSGSYLHLGRGGVYYRQRLGAQGSDSARHPEALPPTQATASPALQDIDSADVGQMVDGSSQEILAELERVHQRKDSFPRSLIGLSIATLTLAIVLPWWALLLVAATNACLLVRLRHLDVTRGTALLEFELRPDAAEAFDRLRDGLLRLGTCQGIWRLEAQGETSDRKYNAGASTLVRKEPFTPMLGLPRRVRSNVQAPYWGAGSQTLYFFPDRLLVYDRTRVGSVAYSELQVATRTVQFIETDRVPNDSQRFGTTWRYVNKKGGPDRRFKDNRELPILLYGELRLTSTTGLNEAFECSRPDVAAHVAEVLRWYGSFTIVTETPSEGSTRSSAGADPEGAPGGSTQGPPSAACARGTSMRDEPLDGELRDARQFYCDRCDTFLAWASLVEVRECGGCEDQFNATSVGRNCPQCGDRVGRTLTDQGCPECLEHLD